MIFNKLPPDLASQKRLVACSQLYKISVTRRGHTFFLHKATSGKTFAAN